jgi:LysM repeat protein
MKKLVVYLAAFPAYMLSFSQPQLILKSGPKGLYLEHTVEPKQGLFPIGRLYSVHPRHIAHYNGLDFNKGLAIGQQIKIPLTDTNFSQQVFEGVPVYYQPTEKESLANISVKYRAPISNIRAWNKLNNGTVAAGTKLIIGFLLTSEMQDRVVKTAMEEKSVSNVKKQEALKNEQPMPEVKNETTETQKTEPVAVTEEIKKTEPEIKKEEPKKTEPEIKKEETQAKEQTKKEQATVIKQQEMRDLEGDGYFKTHFYQQVKSSPLTKEQTVTSSIFKTTSGWQDAKYYLLINTVEPGTIVKITNPSNGKMIFAKVLYGMDKIRENQGVEIRISDAAAGALAVTETDKFILKLNY